jgi:uncharacterized repeat protein (TIGR03803 family)
MRPLYPTFILVLFLVQWTSADAQSRIYGTTSQGGTNGAGVLYSMNTDGSNYQLLHSFQSSPDGAQPTGKLIPGPGTSLYGMTPLGGAGGYGTIFSWDTSAMTYQKLIDLDSIHGSAPYGDLIYYNSKFYGLAKSGGTKNYGTIFSYDPSSGTLADVYDFTLPTGVSPFGSITVFNNVFYFESTGGAAYGNGCLMSFDPATGTATDIFDFEPASEGGTVTTQLIVYNNLLYGTTTGGAGSTFGCIFSLDPRTGAFRDLYDFVSYYWGQYPESLAAYQGILYGVTLSGGGSGTGGVLYSFDPVTLSYSQLYNWQSDYDPTVDGSGPVGPVAIDSTGVLYGATSADGPNGAGIIYNYNVNTNSYNILFGFNWTPTGGDPKSGFILQ